MNTKTTTTHLALKALLELSGLPGEQFVGRLVKIIAKAPDPETACKVITDEFETSGALSRQWRKVITQTWQQEHEHSAYPLELPLTSEDVVLAEGLLDARRVLEELQERPAKLEFRDGEYSLASEELSRLMHVMPSNRYKSLPDVFEDEWSCVHLRRLRTVLQTLRLVRIYGGKLQVVASRYKRFLSLPLPQQYYALWHTDVYHVPWKHFAANWGEYVDVIQEYLPLVWDVAQGTRAGQMQTTTDLMYGVVDVYQGLWEQEGLLAEEGEQHTFMGIYEEHALPMVVGQLFVKDILERWGLIRIHDGLPALIQTGNRNMFSGDDIAVKWTQVGEVMVHAEHGGELPCGLEMSDF